MAHTRPDYWVAPSLSPSSTSYSPSSWLWGATTWSADLSEGPGSPSSGYLRRQPRCGGYQKVGHAGGGDSRCRLKTLPPPSRSPGRRSPLWQVSSDDLSSSGGQTLRGRGKGPACPPREGLWPASPPALFCLVTRRPWGTEEEKEAPFSKRPPLCQGLTTFP